MSNKAFESTPSTPTGEILTPPIDLEMSAPVEISTPPVGFKMSLLDEISTPTSGARMRGGGVRMRGVGVRMKASSEDVSSEARSSSSNMRLRTIDGKIVRMRGNEMDQGLICILNVMVIPTPPWPIGITPEDYRIHDHRPEPVLLQEPNVGTTYEKN
ncbi:hypothetical protein Tco_1370527 [Tanacetum coccineum]